MKGIAFRVPGRPQRPELGSHPCSMNSPGTRERSALVLMLVRQIFEQIFTGCSSVWPFWMKLTSPHPRLPFIANPSLITQNKYAL